MLHLKRLEKRTNCLEAKTLIVDNQSVYSTKTKTEVLKLYKHNYKNWEVILL